MSEIFHNLRGQLALFAVAAFFALTATVLPAAAQEVSVYKSPSCGCCSEWIDHLEEHGFDVKVHSRDNLSPIKSRLGVPFSLQSCHTAKVGGYVVEGHVPARDIRRLLTERPDAQGLAVPGMPLGSPGMEYQNMKEPYDVIIFREGHQEVYSSY